MFRFDQALLLESRGDALECTASVPADMTGCRWPKEALQLVLDGRLLVSGIAGGEKTLEPAHRSIASGQPVLCLPVGVNGQLGLLMLIRAPGRENFSDHAVALARQCAVIGLTALATRCNAHREHEIRRLHELIEQTQRAEQNARAANRLLQELMDRLPIGITVQDSNGRIIMVNTTAASNMATPADVLIGSSPADFLPDEEAAQRRQWEIELLQSGRSVSAEENINDGTGERTWLTSHMPVQICNRTFLLSSSLDITERKQFERQLLRRAHFDELTGLPNRIHVQQQVERLLQRRGDAARFALAFIDIDNFKHINDYYSHAVGDVLLVHIARRIKSRLRDSDTLARISGDEFLLVLDPVEDDEHLRNTVTQILHDLKQPFHVKAFEIFTSASIGVSIYPDHGTTYEELRRNADNAMYRAKHGAKGEAVFFDTAMGRAIAARMEIEQRLRLAIRDRRFCCAFQPKVDIQSQEVVGFETLVRWRDDDGEIHPPGDFIQLAIELGLIDPITNFVLAEAVNSIARLDDAFGSDTTISINVASKQAGDLDFMRPFIETLKTCGYADRIMLELTEDAFTAKSQFQTDVLPALRDIGVRVSIDDFGTGYSSLSVLAEITADEVKVDRSFISDIHLRSRNQSVLRAVESLAQALDMSIVAEGVETFEELVYLRTATHIRYAQGFYFSRPLYLEDLTATRSEALTGRAIPVMRERSDGRSKEPLRTVASRRA
ncbi:MAG TPA: EAL domain-containing protein [Xanthobacteraceae bacterium]|nr:EAL domain-containing protein [Xanthobacteraceae bacterium]